MCLVIEIILRERDVAMKIRFTVSQSARHMANDNNIWHQRPLSTVRGSDKVYKLSWLRKSVDRQVEYLNAI